MVGNADSRLFNIAKYLHRLLADNDSRDAISLRMLDHLQEMLALTGESNFTQDFDDDALRVFVATTPSPDYYCGIFIMQHDREPIVVPLGTSTADSVDLKQKVSYCRLIHAIIDHLTTFMMINKFEIIYIFLPDLTFRYAVQESEQDCKQITILQERLEILRKSGCHIELCYEPLGLLPETKLLKEKIISLSRPF